MRRLHCSASVVVAAALIAATVESAVAQRPERRPRSGLEQPQKLLQVGDKAVDFDLTLLAQKQLDVTVKLSSFEGKQPVVLIFGSYT